MIDRDPHTLAHREDPDTSIDAAVAGAWRKATHRLVLLIIFDMHMTLTSYDAWEAYRIKHGMDLAEVRRRCTDLLNEGLIERTILKRQLPTGRYAYMLRITEAGKNVLRALEAP